MQSKKHSMTSLNATTLEDSWSEMETWEEEEKESFWVNMETREGEEASWSEMEIWEEEEKESFWVNMKNQKEEEASWSEMETWEEEEASWAEMENWEEEEQQQHVEAFQEYVMTHAKVLSEQELYELPVTEHLGEGSFGTVDRVTFKGRDAIRKASKSGGDPTGFLWEARVTLEVDGAGGAPRLHALCAEPAVAVMDYAGVPLYRYLGQRCTVGTFLRVLAGLGESLAEVHDKGFVHNDLKLDNITVSGTPSSPCVHVIDFGLATRVHDSFYFDLFHLPSGLEEQEYAFFRSPELRQGKPLQPSSDVFSVGVMLRDVCACTQHPRLNELFEPLVESCLKAYPWQRPSLGTVVKVVEDMLSSLTKDEQEQILGGTEE